MRRATTCGRCECGLQGLQLLLPHTPRTSGVQLYYGGFVAPNMYFLGLSGCVRFGDLRVAGLSGIYKSGDYCRPYSGCPPYRTPGALKGAYHVRELDVWKLSQLRERVDVFISHDWPQGVAVHGDMGALMRAKPFLRDELQDGSLGSRPGAQLLELLAPDYWFSAHLHTKFSALVPRGGAAPGVVPGATRFLALDKCLPRRSFLQVVDLPDKQPGPLCYDEEWMAVLKATHGAMHAWTSPHGSPGPLPLPSRETPSIAEAQRPAVRAALLAAGGSEMPTTFPRTARPYDPSAPRRGAPPSCAPPPNPQTLHLLSLLQLPFTLGGAQAPPPPAFAQGFSLPPPPAPPEALPNPEELELPED